MEQINSDPGYIGLGVMVVVGLGVALGMWFVAGLLGPKLRNPVKTAPFECGNPSFGTGGKRYAVRFFLVAILFLVFDLEVVFLYPWVVYLKEMTQSAGAYGLLVAVPFLTLLVAGLLYEYGKGALTWE